MIKRTSHQAFSPNNQGIVVLYDHARRDAFAATEHVNHVHMLLAPPGSTPKKRIPSITTIVLLQMQVSMFKMIGSIPSSQSTATAHNAPQPATTPPTPLPDDGATKKSIGHPPRYRRVAAVKGCLQTAARWSLLFGLVVLDNVGRVLGVEEEMANVCEPEEQQQQQQHEVRHYQPYLVESQQQQQQQQEQHVSFNNNNDAITRVPTPPTSTHRSMSPTSPSSPQSPPPPIMINPQPRASSSTHTQRVSTTHSHRQRKISAPTGSSSNNSTSYPHHHRHDCTTSASVTQPMGHARSLSNNMTMPASKVSSSRHSLRRVEAQRDLVSVQSSSSSSTSSLHHRRRVEEDDSENVPSQIHYHHHHHFHQDPSTSSPKPGAIRTNTTTTTTTNGSSSSSKRGNHANPSSSSQKSPWRP
ncbi:hypothetical protein O0I10_000287 [Lichtheimia ornata]|uniref:Uncharacterized protein n=1 Tax=Lichtheimia ornata TaxID=688661 RepID=A0AAD7Y599_9FUNG|nr:uncharacterized protein O0I10_000287 [Lichtheimia ornata]KAJ8664010.1 hypothetical protein O0I10_000287 [Lichtheimia ornata]